MNRSAGRLPAYSLPGSRTIDSDQSRLIGRQRFKPAASRRSVIRFMERGALENDHGNLLSSALTSIPMEVRENGFDSVYLAPTTSLDSGMRPRLSVPTKRIYTPRVNRDNYSEAVMKPGQDNPLPLAPEELRELRQFLSSGIQNIRESTAAIADAAQTENPNLAAELNTLLPTIESTNQLVRKSFADALISAYRFPSPLALLKSTSDLWEQLASLGSRHSATADLATLDDLQHLSATAEAINSRLAPVCSPRADQPSGSRSIQTASPIAGGRLMIVDDQDEIRELLQIRLEQLGCHVLTAPDGETALKLAADHPLDLVLLDVSMPGMNGYEVCERLHASEGTINVPVIFLTATHDPDKIVQGFESGGVDYIGKPFRMTELLARVQTHLDLKRARDTVEHYAARMTILNRQKDKFMQIATHDLRNPLANVRFCCQQLIEGKEVTSADAGQSRLLARIESESARMLDIVENILGFRKTIDGNLQLELTALDLGDLVAETIANQLNRAEVRQMKLIAEIPTDLPRARGDSARTQQVLANYVSNAIKYCPSGSQVTIRASVDADRVRVEVRDNGPGVPEIERDELFREFVQLSNQPAKGEDSTGIGLAIARRLTEVQGGTTGAAFPESGGSVFWFTLPTGDH